jgi:hypothetical protein
MNILAQEINRGREDQASDKQPSATPTPAPSAAPKGDRQPIQQQRAGGPAPMEQQAPRRMRWNPQTGKLEQADNSSNRDLYPDLYA